MDDYYDLFDLVVTVGFALLLVAVGLATVSLLMYLAWRGVRWLTRDRDLVKAAHEQGRREGLYEAHDLVLEYEQTQYILGNVSLTAMADELRQRGRTAA